MLLPSTGRYQHKTKQPQDRNTDAISDIPKRNPSTGGAATYALDHTANGMGCIHVLHLERLLDRNCGIWTEGNCLLYGDNALRYMD